MSNCDHSSETNVYFVVAPSRPFDLARNRMTDIWLSFKYWLNDWRNSLLWICSV